MDVILSQLFVYGQFHADPHPGNLMVLGDGRLALIDFGMAGRFDRHTRGALVDFIRDVQDRDHHRLAEHLLEHGIVGYDTDMRALTASVRELFRSLGRGDMHQQMEVVIRFVVDYRLDFPPDLFFLDKVFGTLDGAVKTLDPSLTTTGLAREFLPKLAKRVVQDWRDVLQRAVSRMLEADGSLVALPTELARVLRRVDAGHLVVRQEWTLSERGVRQVSRLVVQVALLTLGLGLLCLAADGGGGAALGVVVLLVTGVWLLRSR